MNKNKIYSLINELQEEVDQSPNAFMSKKKNVDTEAVMEIIGDIARSLPEELEHAQRVLEEKEQIINAANTQADQIIAQAKKQAAQMTDADAITQVAYDNANKIVDEANENAQEMIQKAQARSEALYNMTSTYAAEVMEEIESYFNEYLDLVHENKIRITSKLNNRPSE